MGNRLLLIILVTGILGVSGTWLLVNNGVNRMLEEQARSESLGWAEFVKGGLLDINHVLRGAPPTIQDLKTLGTAKNVGNVTAFKIYDHDSTVVWSPNFRHVGEENTTDIFKDYVQKGENHVSISHTKDKKTLANAYLSIMENGEFKGAIELTLDLTLAQETGRRVGFSLIIGVGSLFLVLLVITSFFVRSELKRQRKLRFAAEQAAKARNDFIALVSHELRTPLNGVLGALGLLEESKLSKEQEKLAWTAMNSTEHLLEIINDILEFTQVSGHRVTLHPKAVDAHTVADEIALMFKVEAFQKQLDFQVLDHLPETAVGKVDLKRLRQIVFNLVSNAIKFTREGAVTVDFSLSEEGTTRTLTCRVSDTGVGLSPNDLKIIFKRFRQVENTMSRQFSGIGLGLSVCKELAELMRGTLVADSTLGEGSIFTLTIPFPPVENEIQEPEKDIAQTEVQHRDLSILLVEDNAVNQKVLKAVLDQSGHHVSIAENGLEAVQKTEESDFDLILMDIQMPHMDGVEATEKIRSDEKGMNKDTPIIALSANILDEQVETYIQAGMQDYLSKPIKPQDLRQAVLELHHKYAK